jgi:hypothetical protein
MRLGASLASAKFTAHSWRCATGRTADSKHEATMHAVGKDPELKRFYRRKLIQKGMGKARIAAARKLGIRLWIMMRDQIDYEEFCRRGRLRQEGERPCGDA